MRSVSLKPFGLRSYSRREMERNYRSEEFGAEHNEAAKILRKALRDLKVPAFGMGTYERILRDNRISRVDQLVQLGDDDWRRLDFPPLIEARFRDEIEKSNPKPPLNKNGIGNGITSKRGRFKISDDSVKFPNASLPFVSSPFALI